MTPPSRDERLIRRAGRTGKRGAPTPGAERAWRRLRRTGPADSAHPALVRLAVDERHAGHPRLRAARRYLAELWARHRDPGLREVVRAFDLPAPRGEERWVSAALQGRLLEVCTPAAVRCVPRLLRDDDEAVRADAVRVCVTAGSELLGLLWAHAATLPEPALLEGELVRNPHPPPDATLALLWLRWLEDPSGPVREYLFRIGRPAPEDSTAAHVLSRLALGTASGEALCRGVLSEAVPEHLRRSLARTCRERGLLPSDPEDQVIFRVLVGDTGQLGAVDPDGSLLAAAYADAGDPLRARVLDALSAAGELDRIRDLASAPSSRPLGARARTRLVERLTADRDWPRLWGLALGFPPEEAGEAVRRISGWRPSDLGVPGGGAGGEAGELFDLLRGPVFDRLRALPRDPSVPAPVIRIELADGARFRRVVISPDGHRLAAFAQPPAPGTAPRLLDVSLPGGETLARYEPFADAATLRDAPAPVTPDGPGAGIGGWRLTGTPLGDCLVADLHDEIRVYRPFGHRIGGLVRNPLAAASPSDLRPGEAMLAAPTLPAEAAEPLRLLALCLCVRFGDGIALGGAGFMGTSDDIDPGDPGDLGERDG